MRVSPIACLVLLAACGGADSPGGNPRVLYLANDTVETRVKLVDTEPRPF